MRGVCVCVGDDGTAVTRPTASYSRLEQTRGIKRRLLRLSEAPVLLYKNT